MSLQSVDGIADRPRIPDITEASMASSNDSRKALRRFPVYVEHRAATADRSAREHLTRSAFNGQLDVQISSSFLLSRRRHRVFGRLLRRMRSPIDLRPSQADNVASPVMQSSPLAPSLMPPFPGWRPVDTQVLNI